MNRNIFTFIFITFLVISCKRHPRPNEQMILLLKAADKRADNPGNPYCPEAVLRFCDSILHVSSSETAILKAEDKKANAWLELGDEQKAIDIWDDLLRKTSKGDFIARASIMKNLALAWLRLGERTNCIRNHGAESCIFPISVAGVHQDKTGSEKAIELYKAILLDDPNDLESRWLMNIAYMTIGGYPLQVPPAYLLKTSNEDSLHVIKPFADAAGNIGLNFKTMGGGSIVDDFNNDGYLDIVTTSWGLKDPMHYCRNNGNGTFTDISDSSGLGYLTGGLNIMQTDYNNDGYKDIFVLRGAWKATFGKDPNSLLRNNGDGTFTDVTKESGLLSFHPTQTATWADFNNDGWLDVFIGNETTPGDQNLCELYINNRNGTFTETATTAGCNVADFVKGVTAGDYDNDGLTDIFISTLTGQKILLKNETVKNGPVRFSNVTQQAGLNTGLIRSFPTWFWDYDNDGWLDILVCGYEFTEPLAYYASAEALGIPVGNAGKIFLYRNRHDGTFEDVSGKTGLNKIAFAMGANFGDIDNDGYPDFYLGTGNPKFKSLIPNKLFKNAGGDHFLDVTASARVGNLQKGHGISFADFDNDGDEDIYIVMGGAYAGDAYENSLYLNPGQGNNHWINITLEGTVSNRVAIGAKIKVSFEENGKLRSVYHDVNSGGSFGANPLRQHIGVGQADIIKTIEIKWPVTGKVQMFRNVPVDDNIRIREGADNYSTYKLAYTDIASLRSGLISCSPK